MHQCFGAMDARVDALDARVVTAQNHYIKQMMRVMEETERTVHSRVVCRRVDSHSVMTQPRDISRSCHVTGVSDLRRGGGVENGVVHHGAGVGASSQVFGAVGLDVQGCKSSRGIEYRVYICDRTLQNIWDEFEGGLNVGAHL